MISRGKWAIKSEFEVLVHFGKLRRNSCSSPSALGAVPYLPMKARSASAAVKSESTTAGARIRLGTGLEDKEKGRGVSG